MKSKTVVLVCMVDSVHVYRWLTQFDDTQISFILFPSTPNRKIHPGIKAMLEADQVSPFQVSIAPFGGKLSVPLWAIDRLGGNRLRGYLLRRILKLEKPDFLHALEFQNAGYISSVALNDKKIKTPFIVTNYGSDIYWFRRFKGHEKKIKKLLSRADMYSAECIRDYGLANELGFRGKELEVSPNAGGIDLSSLKSTVVKCSERKAIIVKGYHGWAGRALIALEAIELIAEKLQGFEIFVYSANLKVYLAANRLQKRTGLKIKVFRKKKLSHSQMLELFVQSRVYIGLSVTDGISTSLLEAMATGAFPIQTATSCADEWIVNKETGFLVSDLSVKNVASGIEQAILDNELVDFAQVANLELIQSKANLSKVRESKKLFYNLF